MAAGLRTPAGYGANDCAAALTGGTPTKCGIGDAAQFMAAQLAGQPDKLTCAALILADISDPSAPDAPGICFPPGNVRPPLTDATGYNQAVLDSMRAQLAAGATQLEGLTAGLQAIEAGVDGPGSIDGLAEGVAALRKALYNASCDPSQTDPAAANYCGFSQALSLIRAGVPTLVDGLAQQISQTLLANIGTGAKGCDPTTTLMCGANALVDGSGQLKTGAGQLASGVDQLDKGGSKLSSGAGDLADGLRQLDDGAGQLATGLQDAKDGSGQLADGLGQAADGAPQLVDGSERLSTEGTKKLVEAGESTAQNYGEMVAVMDAGAKRAQTEDMANGAPADALGLTAYSYVIKGEDGEGGRNLARGFGAVVILAAGAGVLALRRRFV